MIQMNNEFIFKFILLTITWPYYISNIKCVPKYFENFRKQNTKREKNLFDYEQFLEIKTVYLYNKFSFNIK